MKKIFCIFFSLLLIVGTLLPAAAQTDTQAPGFAVATDLHYVRPMPDTQSKLVDLYPDISFAGADNVTANESGFVIDAFLRQCAEDDGVQYVFLTGDLATYGRDLPEEHEALAEKLAAFEDATGKSVYVINGNHDNGKKSVTNHEKFAEIYARFGYDEAVSRDTGSCSYAARLGERYMLIALDSCDEGMYLADGLDAARLRWVKQQASLAEQEGRYTILLMHHNLLEHKPLQLLTDPKYMVRFPRTYASLFADWGIKLVFSGHTHEADAAQYTSACGNTVVEFVNAALTAYPAQYKVFSLAEDAVRYSTKSVQSIDTAALSAAVRGYTDAELQWMQTDFPGWIRDKYLTVEAERVKQALTAEGLGFKQGDLFYPTVKAITDGILADLQTPLYGENSVSRAAAEYGIQIPHSDYADVQQVIAQIAFGKVDGTRRYGFDSAEAQIVLGYLQCVLRRETAALRDDTCLKLANQIAANLGRSDTIAADAARTFSQIFGARTGVETLALALLSPYLQGCIGTDSAPDNHSGTLPGCGAKTPHLQNIAAKTISTFRTFWERLVVALKILLRIY